MEKIFPFFWLRGENPQIVGDAIRKMHSYGIDAFVVESRIHQDFCGDSWFEEMDTVLRTASEEHMKVWLLDDKQFPTGRANEKLKKIYPEKNTWRVKLERTDICGPLKNAKVILRANLKEADEILGVYLAKRGNDPTKIDMTTVVDLSADVEKNMLFLDVPEGEHTVYALIKTLSGSHLPYYIDMLNADSVGVLIDEVYEKHYERYAEYFGNTFAGFFSDEPCFSNGGYAITPAPGFYETKIGQFGTAYPWSQEVLNRLGVPLVKVLSLWLDIGEETAAIRIAYMNAITSLYAKNFTGQLSGWCHAHGVKYIGHIVEDHGSHMRLGPSAGHYFRSMYGADISGIDVVLHQIKPFENRYMHYAPIAGGYADPEFFDYTLAKLAYSDARHDPRKKGNAFCEIFGAYGWGESMDEMLYLANHMLVRGINHFVPHAFFHSEGLTDCPPHFLVGNAMSVNQSQKMLFAYMTKLSSLLSDGDSEADTVVWYNAEAEWSGKTFTSLNRVAKQLTEAQVAFCFADTDTLANAVLGDNSFDISGHSYKKLIIPTFEKLPEEIIATLKRLERFAEYSDGTNEHDGDQYRLRVYRYEKNGECYEMLFNEGTAPVVYENPKGFQYALDYLNGTYRTIDGTLTLGGAEAVILRNQTDGLLCIDGFCECGSINRFDVKIQSFDSGLDFEEYRKGVDTSFDINARGEKPCFSGRVRYTFEVDLHNCDGMRVAYRADACEIRFGGEEYVGANGTVWCIPEKKPVGRMPVEVTLLNSRAYQLQDSFSLFDALRPCMLDKVVLLRHSKEVLLDKK